MYNIKQIFSDNNNKINNIPLDIEDHTKAEQTCLIEAYNYSSNYENKKIVAGFKNNIFVCDIFSNGKYISSFILENELNTVEDVINYYLAIENKDLIVEIQDKSEFLLRLSVIKSNGKLSIEKYLLKSKPINYTKTSYRLIITI